MSSRVWSWQTALSELGALFLTIAILTTIAAALIGINSPSSKVSQVRDYLLNHKLITALLLIICVYIIYFIAGVARRYSAQFLLEFAHSVFLLLAMIILAFVATRLSSKIRFLLVQVPTDLLANKKISLESELIQSQKILNKAMEAWDEGEITTIHLKEIEQTISLVKWLIKGDETGWLELEEEVLHGDGLSPKVRSIIEQEVERVQQKEHPNKEYQAKLNLLIKFKEPPINKTLEGIDEGEVSVADALEAEQTLSLFKWIRDSDINSLSELKRTTDSSTLSPWMKLVLRQQQTVIDLHSSQDDETEKLLDSLLLN